MADTIRWEYRVVSVGGAFRGVNDKDMAETLTQLALEGWELVSVHYPYSSPAKVIVRREVSEIARRQRNWPGQE